MCGGRDDGGRGMKQWSVGGRDDWWRENEAMECGWEGRISSGGCGGSVGWREGELSSGVCGGRDDTVECIHMCICGRADWGRENKAVD